jgi:excisionase family DNA binding protein
VSEYSTLREIAEQLKFSERKLRDIIRRHDIPVLQAGRDIRFNERAIAALEEALLRPCRSGSTDAKALHSSKSTLRSRGNAYAEARKLLTEGSRARRPQRSKQSSSEPPGTGNVVALDHSRRRS